MRDKGERPHPHGRKMNRKDVLLFVRSLNDREFAELFYEMAASRTRKSRHKQLVVEKSYLALADVGAVLRDDGEYAYEVHLVGLGDASKYEKLAGFGEPFFAEAGNCRACGQLCISWVKNMLCPVCGAETCGT